MNQDNRTHQMMSNPHPLHTDRPEVNAVGTRSVILVGDAERDPNYY